MIFFLKTRESWVTMDKNKQQLLLCAVILIGCAMLSLGLVSAGNQVRQGLYEVADVVSGKIFNTVVQPPAVENHSDVMSIYEAGRYLLMDMDTDADASKLKVMQMVESGELAGTYVKLGNDYLFSREKLQQWFMTQTEK